MAALTQSDFFFLSSSDIATLNSVRGTSSYQLAPLEKNPSLSKGQILCPSAGEPLYYHNFLSLVDYYCFFDWVISTTIFSPYIFPILISLSATQMSASEIIMIFEGINAAIDNFNSEIPSTPPYVSVTIPYLKSSLPSHTYVANGQKDIREFLTQLQSPSFSKLPLDVPVGDTPFSAQELYPQFTSASQILDAIFGCMFFIHRVVEYIDDFCQMTPVITSGSIPPSGDGYSYYRAYNSADDSISTGYHTYSDYTPIGTFLSSDRNGLAIPDAIDVTAVFVVTVQQYRSWSQNGIDGSDREYKTAYATVPLENIGTLVQSSPGSSSNYDILFTDIGSAIAAAEQAANVQPNLHPGEFSSISISSRVKIWFIISPKPKSTILSLRQ